MGFEDWELTPKDTPDKTEETTEPEQQDETAEQKQSSEDTIEDEVSEDANVYKGPERRKGERRKGHDRREEVRFEQKVDRRSGIERRRVEGLWKLRDF